MRIFKTNTDFEGTLTLLGVNVLTATTGYTRTHLSTSGQSSVHWGNLTSTPTTLAGYGITDAAPLTHTHDALYAPKAGGTDIVTVGAITTGSWHGTVINTAHGGTGKANTADLELTIPATGTAALRGANNVFTAHQYLAAGYNLGVGTETVAIGPLSIPGVHVKSTTAHAGLFLDGGTGYGGFLYMGANGTAAFHVGATVTAFDIVHTGDAVNLRIDSSGHLFLYTLRSGATGAASGEIYVDASGYLKRA